jgi:hypothetical protein
VRIPLFVFPIFYFDTSRFQPDIALVAARDVNVNNLVSFSCALLLISKVILLLFYLFLWISETKTK